jgi:hypothetical protein
MNFNLTQLFKRQNPADNILSSIYNSNNTKINILNYTYACRLHCLLLFMKKNKISITKDKILLICHLFDKYKNIKLIDDKYNFDLEISKIRNKTLINFMMSAIASILFFLIKLQEKTAGITLKDFLSKMKYKKFIIIICILIIGCIFFYKYTYNYMKDEFTCNTQIVSYIKKIKSPDDIYLHLSNFKAINEKCVLYCAMLNKLSLETINKFDNINMYINNITKQDLRDTVLTHFAEKINEAIKQGEKQGEKQTDQLEEKPEEKPVEKQEEKQTDQIEEKQTDQIEEKQIDQLEEKQTDQLEEKQTDQLEEKQTDQLEEKQTDQLEEKQTDQLEEKQGEKQGEQLKEKQEEKQEEILENKKKSNRGRKKKLI